MTNYEAIKQMSLEEMGATFYMFIKPVLGGATKEQQAEIRKMIKDFLETEVRKPNADRASETHAK